MGATILIYETQRGQYEGHNTDIRDTEEAV